MRRALNVPRLASMLSKAPVGTTPHDVVLTQGTHRLLRYRRHGLFAAAIAGRPHGAITIDKFDRMGRARDQDIFSIFP